MTFGEAISSGFENYATLRGRASRSAYWYFYLFIFLVNLGLNFVAGFARAAGGQHSPLTLFCGLLVIIFALGIMIPNFCVSIRRLHDTDRSGWWFLINLTVIGMIPFLIFLCLPSTPGPNRFDRF